MQLGTNKEGGQNGAFLEHVAHQKKDSLGTVEIKNQNQKQNQEQSFHRVTARLQLPGGSGVSRK